MKNKWYLRTTALITSVVMITSLISCSSEKTSVNRPPNSQEINIASNLDDAEITDAFVELQINDIDIKDIQVVDISINDITVNSINIKSIENKETQVVDINDSMVTLAYENFVSYYGDNINLKKLISDIAIGATVVIVCVTLTTVAGPVGTFFGAVVTSEFSAAAVAVGAAIDAAVSGYQAYQEGGDLEYIIGHMLNGVAEGFKWSAFLAPLSGGVSGIQALRAVSKLKNVPGFEDVSHQTARAIFENLSKILKNTSNLAENASDDVIRKLFKDSFKDLSKEIDEELFLKLFKDDSLKTITDIARRFNPFNVSSDIGKELCDQFWKKADIPEETFKKVIKQFINGTIRNIDDITDEAIKKYIKSNFKEFVELYGKTLSKDFMDNYLKQSIGDEGLKLLKQSIKEKDSYRQLIKNLPKETVDDFLNDTANLLMIQCRFGAEDMSRLINLKTLSSQLSSKNYYSDDLIDKILALNKQNITDPNKTLGLTDKQIMVIGNDIAEYCRVTNTDIYREFNKQFAEIRGEAVIDFITENNVKMDNTRYAGGIMIPTGEKAELVKKQYGDIYMSSHGFAIFDDHAIARVELPNLTGGDKDIAEANKAYWGKAAYKDSGYVWHHLEDGKTLILIPKDLHEAYSHTGGAALIRKGLNAAA